MVQLFAGRFALIDRVGVGATGVVWRAFDGREGRLCAAKVVSSRDVEGLLRVVREQGVRLTHPHVAAPYAWAADEDIVIAMELVLGGTLATLIRDHGSLPVGYAVRVLSQLLDALDHVHSAGLVHRDVKPTNVLMEPTGTGPPHCRLGDFGIARTADVDQLTETGVVVGTPGYLPPEACAGAAPNPARDVFAAGVVCWQMLTGAERPPDDGGYGPRPDGVPAGLWTALMCLLAPDAERRPTSAVEATALLRELVAADEPSLLLQHEDGDPVEVFDLLGPAPFAGRPDGSAAPAVGPPTSQAVADPLAADRRGRPGLLSVVGAIVVSVVVIAAATLAVRGVGTPDGSVDRPAQRPSPAMTGAGLDAGAGQASPARPPLAGVRAGGPCQWQDVGSVETDETGQQVRCTYDTGSYQWRVIP